MKTPTPTRCPKCGTLAAEWICHICKTVKEPRHTGDRAVFVAALASISIALLLGA